ncbi:MAG: flagellar assembly peptidoglycan hydrolase FlgJ [Gammaproteobacteria bacterium]
MTTPMLPPPVYTDFSGLDKLRAEARSNSPAALHSVAQQFEGIFLQMVLKSMREANFGDGLFDSDQTKFYRDLFDHQVSLSLASHGGIGLAEMMVKQLQRTRPADTGQKQQPQAAPGETLNDYRRTPQAHATLTPAAVGESGKPAGSSTAMGADSPQAFATPTEFVHAIWGYVKTAASKLGVAPQAIVAQAALETGWGKHIMRHDDGSSSHNLFGIKADSAWNGKRVAATTVEFDGGVVARRQAVFRAYDSVGQSVADYVHLLQSSGRYQAALQAGGPARFAAALQQAGYATDPDYAQKINGIVNSDTFRQAMDGLKL